MEKDGLISFVLEEEKCKSIRITDLGRKVLDIGETKQVIEWLLYRNSREGALMEKKVVYASVPIAGYVGYRGFLYPCETHLWASWKPGKVSHSILVVSAVKYTFEK